MHTRISVLMCDIAEGREAYTHGHHTTAAASPVWHRLGWLSCASVVSHKRAAACDAEVSEYFTDKVELQNMEPYKTSTSLWSKLWENKISNYTLLWLITTEGTSITHHSKALKLRKPITLHGQDAHQQHPTPFPNVNLCLNCPPHNSDIFSSNLPLDCQVVSTSKSIFHFWILNPPHCCWTDWSVINLVLKPRAS